MPLVGRLLADSEGASNLAPGCPCLQGARDELGLELVELLTQRGESAQGRLCVGDVDGVASQLFDGGGRRRHDGLLPALSDGNRD